MYHSGSVALVFHIARCSDREILGVRSNACQACIHQGFFLTATRQALVYVEPFNGSWRFSSTSEAITPTRIISWTTDLPWSESMWGLVASYLLFDSMQNVSGR